MPENGRYGEEKAADFLKNKGYQIIGRNFRHRGGEVDIIALDNDTVVFTEVKTWAVLGIDSLEQGLDKKKQRRIIETAKYFLSDNRKYRYMAVRFDVIFITPGSVTHLESAFTERV